MVQHDDGLQLADNCHVIVRWVISSAKQPYTALD